MAISTFNELKTAVLEWSDAEGQIEDKLDEFVSMATHSFNYGAPGVPALRTRQMVTTTDLTPTASVCTLPTDYLQYRRVVEKASIRRELSYITPSSVEDMYADRGSRLSNHFTIIGSTLRMFPLSSNAIELTYFQKIPELTDAAPTNWLLTAHPSIYLQATLMQVGIFMRHDDLTARSAQFISSLIPGLQSADVMANYAYAPSRPRGMVIA